MRGFCVEHIVGGTGIPCSDGRIMFIHPGDRQTIVAVQLVAEALSEFDHRLFLSVGVDWHVDHKAHRLPFSDQPADLREAEIDRAVRNGF